MIRYYTLKKRNRNEASPHHGSCIMYCEDIAHKNRIMSTTGSSSAICSDCKTELPNHGQVRRPCPNCGSTSRAFIENVQTSIHASTEISWVHTREFYKNNYRIHALIIVLMILELVLGFLLKGITSLVISIFLSIVTYFLGPYAATKVREITRG
jgi:predicted RNA-binding Zn-ribbon protein involved in translation (DUF1610 family)